MKLRDVLGQLVVATLAGGCASSHTGGGCPDNDVKYTVRADADEALKTLVAACDGTPASCDPVCKELFDRQHENGAGVHACHVTKHDGIADVAYTWGHYCAGRRPWPMASAPATTARAWLSEQGRLEAASVIAFRRLARDLELHRAPGRLVDACRRAARDEARHARACGAAIAHGPARTTPAIEELALDNAVEGEVRETWGAVIAAWQARTARSPSIRRIMRTIAPDELRHAELARELARFYASRLSVAQRTRVAATRAEAIAEVTRAAADEPPRPLVDEVGLPSGRDGARLAAGLGATIWA